MSARITRTKLALILSAAELVCARTTLAESIRADTSDSLYQALSAQPQYAASGYIDAITGETASFGSGTLIAPDWVLTAAHVVTVDESGPAIPASGVTFGQGPNAIVFSPAADAVAQVVVEPGFDGNGPTQGNDLALIQLATPITNVTPAQLYTSSLGSELGQTATIIGYGESGNGDTGDDDGMTAAGTRRGEANVIDAFGGTFVTGGSGRHQTTTNLTKYSPDILLTDFDNPNQNDARTDNIMGSSVPTALEGATIPGDSGGGVFLTENGQTYLAAVTDFGLNVLSSANPTGLYGDVDGYTRLDVSQSVSFLDASLITNNSWNLPGGGSWTGLANWTNSAIPEFAGSTANFGSSITTASSVNLDADWTVGAVTFNNTNSYTLATGASGVLTLDNGGPNATASLSVLLGNHSITAPVILNSNVNITIANPTDSLTISGNISGHGGLAMGGAGVLTLAAANNYSGPTSVNSGTLILAVASALPANPVTVGTTSSTALLQLAPGVGPVNFSTLTINPGSTVDLTNNAIAFNYTTSSPVSAIAAALASGYNSGAWTGPGIVSSTAAANSAVMSVGYADGNLDPGTAAQPNQVFVAYTLAGDANLDGTVGFADLVVVAQHFGSTGNDWAAGNFTYDPSGSVGFADLVLVAQNFGQSIAIAQSQLSPDFSLQGIQSFSATASIPEPTAAGLIILGLGGILTRRRVKSC